MDRLLTHTVFLSTTLWSNQLNVLHVSVTQLFNNSLVYPVSSSFFRSYVDFFCNASFSNVRGLIHLSKSVCWMAHFMCHFIFFFFFFKQNKYYNNIKVAEYYCSSLFYLLGIFGLKICVFNSLVYSSVYLINDNNNNQQQYK